MKHILDTNIISELSKPQPHGAVMAWFDSQLLSDCAIPSIALYEMQDGIERTRIQHPGRAAQLDLWIDKLARNITIATFDGEAARETARLIHGKSLDHLEDAMIAAIAK